MKQEDDNIRVNNWKVDFQHYPHTHSLTGFSSVDYIFTNETTILTILKKYWHFENFLAKNIPNGRWTWNHWIINPTLCHLEGESLY